MPPEAFVPLYLWILLMFALWAASATVKYIQLRRSCRTYDGGCKHSPTKCYYCLELEEESNVSDF